MTYVELVDKLKSNFEGMDAGRIKEHVAIQFNVAGEAEGALYMEISNGKIMVEPYEYYDRDILVFVETDALLAIADGKCTIYDAFKEGKFYAEGNLGKAELLDSISKKVAAKKRKEEEEAEQRVAEEAQGEEVQADAAPTEAPVVEAVTTEEAVTEAESPVVEKAPVKEEAPVAVESVSATKKSGGKKTPSRKLKKAAAKRKGRK